MNITKSESWMDSWQWETADQERELNEAIETFEIDEASIVSIQLVETNGQKRFWIYHK